MTETEIAFAAMTLDELREAGEFIDNQRRFFAQSRTIEFGQVAATEGPQLALDGLVLAWFREVQLRYGGPEWFAGAALDDHPQGRLVGILLERMALVPDGDRRLKRAQVEPDYYKRRACARCSQRKVVSADNFELVGDDYLSVVCRTCVADLGIQADDLAREREEALRWGVADVPEDEQRAMAAHIAEAMSEPVGR